VETAATAGNLVTGLYRRSIAFLPSAMAGVISICSLRMTVNPPPSKPPSLWMRNIPLFFQCRDCHLARTWKSNSCRGCCWLVRQSQQSRTSRICMDVDFAVLQAGMLTSQP
jgi:hypothetical protein